MKTEENLWKQMDGYGSQNQLTDKWKHVRNHAGFYLQVQGGIAVSTSTEKQKQNDESERASSKGRATSVRIRYRQL